jgi:hypothetical protein
MQKPVEKGFDLLRFAYQSVMKFERRNQRCSESRRPEAKAGNSEEESGA